MVVEVFGEGFDGTKILAGTVKGTAVGATSDWACSLALKADKITPIVHSACTAVLSTISNEAINVVIGSLIEKNKWTHSTYSELIKHSFYNQYLEPTDISDRLNKSYDYQVSTIPFVAQDGEPHGIIYTKKDQPTNIKYLKVISQENKGVYTLYGNSQSNDFECREITGCFMYGAGGDDRFTQQKIDSHFIIKDFKEKRQIDGQTKEDTDQLFLRNDFSQLKVKPMSNINPEKGGVIQMSYFGSGNIVKSEIKLEGRSLGEMEGWVSVADGSYRNTPKGMMLSDDDWKALQRNNAIQIK